MLQQNETNKRRNAYITCSEFLFQVNSNKDDTGKVDDKVDNPCMQQWACEKTPNFVMIRQKCLAKGPHFIKPAIARIYGFLISSTYRHSPLGATDKYLKLKERVLC